MRRGVSFIMVAYPGPEKSIAGIAVLISYAQQSLLYFFSVTFSHAIKNKTEGP